ncbi:molybdopterin-dependent oxidoreductase [Stappia indica]|uniref:molybdopterin-dependent oxidoreductase n=1 Tax=Stappia indica TaxID=538381 RepID=UPI001CD69285|nr:molybdopterin-dependent oxidoreductase [Stappia indica]MCA1299966.1 molybdopterin-dependent oxidoreductase [Stappia indica]
MGFMVLGVLAGSVPVAAASSEPVVLTVLEETAAGEGVRVTFTAPQLEALGLRRIETETPWSNGSVVFEGPLLRDVLAKAGMQGESLKAVALNDYQVMIPVSDVAAFDVILATRADGKAIGVRERGPVRVIYPWSEQEELQAELYYARAIWQLRSISVLAGPRQ